MLFFLILVNIVLATLLSFSQGTKNVARGAPPASNNLAKADSGSRPFMASRGRRSGWAIVDADTEDKGVITNDGYGYMEPVEDERYYYSGSELWVPRLKRDNIPGPLAIENILDQAEPAENHSAFGASRPRRYSYGAPPSLNEEILNAAQRNQDAMQEIFSIWLNQMKRSAPDPSPTQDVPRPFFAARG